MLTASTSSRRHVGFALYIAEQCAAKASFALLPNPVSLVDNAIGLADKVSEFLTNPILVVGAATKLRMNPGMMTGSVEAAGKVGKVLGKGAAIGAVVSGGWEYGKAFNECIQESGYATAPD